MKIQKFFILIIGCWLLVNFLSGCVTAPVRETLPTYNINGVAYFPLISFCEQRNIHWDYDTFTKTVNLSKGEHKINLRVGDTLVLVDGKAINLSSPIELYQGTVVLPYKFKEHILDTLFLKEPYAKIQERFAVLSIRRIVIDAGHGGNDPGAIGKSGLREKDVNLDIAKRLSRLLKENGVEVVMTRTNDIFVSLERRVIIANKAKADLFISIHSNANRVRSLNGFEVYYISSGVSDLRRALSTAKNTELHLQNASFASQTLNLKATLWDMIYTYNRAESIALAADICRVIDRDLNTRVIGVKSAAFHVLKGVHMPGVLVEIGFLSNRNEERLLKNAYYRQQIAEAIEQGIENYAKDYAYNRRVVD